MLGHGPWVSPVAVNGASGRRTRPTTGPQQLPPAGRACWLLASFLHLNRWFGTSGTTPQDICDYQVAFLLRHVEWGPSPGIGFVDVGAAVDQGLNQLRKSVTGNIVEGRPALAG